MKLNATDVHFHPFGVGDAIVGCEDLAQGLFDGGLDAVHLQFEDLLRRRDLFPALVAEQFDEFLSSLDLRVQLGDFRVFRPQEFAQAFPLKLEQFQVPGGTLALAGSGRRDFGIGAEQRAIEIDRHVASERRVGLETKRPGFEELGLQDAVGKFGTESRQGAPGNGGFLLDDRQVVGALEGDEIILFRLQIPLQTQHLLRDGSECVSRHDFANVFFVLNILNHERAQVGLDVGRIRGAGLEFEHRTFGRLSDPDLYLERLAVLAQRNGIRPGRAQARQRQLPKLAALEQFGLRAQKVLHVFAEHGALRQTQCHRLPHPRFGNVSGRLPKKVPDRPAQAEREGEDRHPPVLQQKCEEPLDVKRREQVGVLVHRPGQRVLRRRNR